MKRRFDTEMIGLNIGIVLPILIGFLFYPLMKYGQAPGMTVSEYIDLVSDHLVLPKLLTVALIGDMFASLFFFWKDLHRAGMGIIYAMAIYALIIVAIIFF
ncbi:MAG: hypothetical protein IIA45_00625 [Bacteroidetes bacterium]|nr:hypothetical protein [Bacteroidota bacterium]